MAKPQWKGHQQSAMGVITEPAQTYFCYIFVYILLHTFVFTWMLQAFQSVTIVTISTIYTRTHLFQKDCINLSSTLNWEHFAVALLPEHQVLMVIKEIVQPSCKNNITLFLWSVVPQFFLFSGVFVHKPVAILFLLLFYYV